MTNPNSTEGWILLSPCNCGAGTIADCLANTCAKVQDAARRNSGIKGAPGETDCERAVWLADKTGALGDYAQEAASMLRRWPGAPGETGDTSGVTPCDGGQP